MALILMDYYQSEAPTYKCTSYVNLTGTTYSSASSAYTFQRNGYLGLRGPSSGAGTLGFAHPTANYYTYMTVPLGAYQTLYVRKGMSVWQSSGTFQDFYFYPDSSE